MLRKLYAPLVKRTFFAPRNQTERMVEHLVGKPLEGGRISELRGGRAHAKDRVKTTNFSQEPFALKRAFAGENTAFAARYRNRVRRKIEKALNKGA